MHTKCTAPSRETFAHAPKESRPRRQGCHIKAEDFRLPRYHAHTAPQQPDTIGGGYGPGRRAPLLTRQTDGRAFRLIGIAVHDLAPASQPGQGDLFGAASPTEGKVDKALDAVREKFGEDAVVSGRSFGTKLQRQGPSKVE